MDVKKIYKLANLKAEPAEMNQFAAELQSIVEAFEAIKKVETSGVEPLITPVAIEQSLRPDLAESWSEGRSVVESAPDSMGNLFKTPPVI